MYRQFARKISTSANSALIRYYLPRLHLSSSTLALARERTPSGRKLWFNFGGHFYANYQSSDNNFAYGIGFVIHENVCLYTQIAFLLELVEQLLVLIRCKSISAAILDCEVSTNGNLGNFLVCHCQHILKKISLLRIYLMFTM